MTSLQAKLQMLLRKVVKRSYPHTLASWRFLQPNPSAVVRLHRRVFIQAWPNLPRTLWTVICLYNMVLWWLFFAWRNSLRSWRAHSHKHLQTQNRLRQLVDLLHLALLHGIPPGFYYRYRLFNHPSNVWLDFIFSHELPHWHLVLSIRSARDSSELLNDKYRFALKMESQGLPVVATAPLSLPHDLATDSALFEPGCSRFLKPRRGNQARGCLKLIASSAAPGHQLIDFIDGTTLASGRQAIVHCLSRQQQRHDLLKQPLLENHEQIKRLVGRRDLVTIRLVTVIVGPEIVPALANLEVPLKKNGVKVLLFPLNCTSGKVKEPASGHPRKRTDEARELLTQIVDHQLPFWDIITRVCSDAHRHFSDIRTIGWDVVISTEGVRLLEGNTNWNVAAHQTHNDEPILSGALLQSYLESLP